MAINPLLNETHDDYALYEFRTYPLMPPGREAAPRSSRTMTLSA